MTLDPSDPVDLTNCDREPIHLLGRVQSYGALIALTPDWIVQQASDNLAEVLGVAPATALGQPFSTLITSDALARVEEALSRAAPSQTAARLFGVMLKSDGRLFDMSIHQSGDLLVVEFEPKASQIPSDVMSEVYPLISQLDANAPLADMAQEAAEGLRHLSGFDSVMVYQFQPDASGRVIAEDRADGTRRYHGLAFPASDIPVQARALYKRSLLRLIADVEDPGSFVRPGMTAAGTPIDLSLAVTRAVSPIHIEYLRNMGVGASMSVSILKDGQLWGLFACHHDSARYIDFERRTAVELFAHLFAFELAKSEERRAAKVQAATQKLQTRIMAQLAQGADIKDSLISVSRDIGRVIGHDGLALYADGQITEAGRVPGPDQIETLARLLDRRASTEPFASHHLADHIDDTDLAAGLLAIPISRNPRDYLMLFRAPQTASVTWAGNPQKPVEVGPNGTRLTPRESFAAWEETVEGRSAPWSEEDLQAAAQLRVVLLEVFLKISDAIATERKRAQEQQELLIAELNHRVRNILNLIQGLVSQTRAGANSVAAFTEQLDGRIQSLARAHDQLTRDHWEPASFHALLATEVEAYADGQFERMVIHGPDAMVSPNAYTVLALVFHEMVTNALKHGGLKSDAGRVEVTCAVDGAGGVNITWVERGGPAVQAPTRRGFGSAIIELSIPHELKGEAHVTYKVTGVEARFRVPPAHVAQVVEPRAPKAPAPDTPAPGAFALTGPALVVEDSLIVAMDAQGMLEDFGADPVEIAASVEAALAMLEKHAFSIALLDVNLGDAQSIPVAEALAAKGVPYVLATGYGDTEDLRQSYPPCEIVQKPFSNDSLRQAMAKVLS